MNKKKITVATHDGKFHCDEVFAVAILKRIYPDLYLIRTRDGETLAKADIRVDVGGKYDHATKDYDHHQRGFNEKGPTGILHSSVGLIWKHYGENITKSKRVQELIEETLIRFIDAGDNGVEFTNGKVFIYSVGSVVNSFNPYSDDANEDNQFNKAVEFASGVLKRELKRATALEKAETKVRALIKKNKHKEYIIFEEDGLPKGTLAEDKNLKLVVFPRKGGAWGVEGIPKNPIGFERRMYLPKEWSGLTQEALQKVSGIRGAFFCHKSCFTAAADTKEQALAMVEKALKTRNTSSV